jgi:hypothetical protein
MEDELVVAYINKNGKDISDIIRGKLLMLKWIIGFKNTFDEVDKLNQMVEEGKKGVR